MCLCKDYYSVTPASHGPGSPYKRGGWTEGERNETSGPQQTTYEVRIPQMCLEIYIQCQAKAQKVVIASVRGVRVSSTMGSSVMYEASMLVWPVACTVAFGIFSLLDDESRCTDMDTYVPCMC